MASFPTSIPSFEAKSTENDVSGSITRINGADINSMTDEIVALATRVGVDGSSEPASLECRLSSIEQGKRVFAGSSACSAGASTVVSDANCTAAGKVFLQASSSGFAALTGVYVSAVGDGSFTVTHSMASGDETFDYLIAKE